ALEKDLDEKSVLRMAEQLLDALEMAHAHGILHGAITPSNVLVTPRGSVRLCDFATPPGLGTTRTTEEDMLAALRAGPFTAPERQRRDAAAARESSDVSALGACMYFAIVKQPPPSNPDPAARPPWVRDAVPAIGANFSAIVAHALQVDPMHRYESAYAMLGDV